MRPQAEDIEFERLVRQNELLIHKVCRMYAYTQADRDDLYQEIVLQLWRSWQGFRGGSQFSTWLYRVALNTAITGLRRQQRTVRATETELPQLPDPAPAGEEEQLQDLYRAISRLTEIEKAVVMLYLEEKTYEEMEEVLGISSGTLRVRMNRIREKLRQLTKNSAHGTG